MDEPTSLPPGSGNEPSAGRGGLPERIGSYRVLGRLGRGGMGEVFLAWDDRLRRKVAIKRIRDGDSDVAPALRQRLLREARAAASLNHSAIVQVYDLMADDEGDCIVMEYVEGRTLGARLSEGPLPLDMAVRLAREITEGLATAHAAGIVHRDLKADNVIVTPGGHARVLDFGLARRLSGATDEVILTQHGFILGTCHAMSPEQAAGGEADARSDLFSLGILLYHMLTGVSPFLAATPRETLQRVLHYQPPSITSVRADVPPGLGALVTRLLAKSPEDRPQNAEAVIRALGSPTLESIAPLELSVSELATGVREATTAVAIPRTAAAHGSTAGMSVLTRRRAMRTAAFVAVPVLAVLGVLAGWQLLTSEKPAALAVAAAPLRVVVPQPKVNGNDERLQLAASGVLTASLSTLGSLDGVAAIDPPPLGASSSAPDMARAAAADEVLVATLDQAGVLGRITLRRVQGSGGRVLWSDTFDAPIEATDLRFLADAVSIHLRRGYPDRHQRPGTFSQEVRDKDYAEFLKIKQDVDSGSVSPQNDLPRLESIIGQSPRFLEARVLAARTLLTRFESTKEVAYRTKALALVQEARKLAPNDSRPLEVQFDVELAGDQPQVAAATLAQLEALMPGDPRIFLWRAALAEREGRMEEALAALRPAAERFPSWRNILALADLEARTGHIDDARQHLRKLLASSPNNIWALTQLARIELLFGDLNHAEQIFQELIAKAPERNNFTNLGVIRVLLGRYEEAVAAFHKALALDPGQVDVTLNLAEAELALGRTREAQEHFQAVLRDIEKNRPPGGLSGEASMTKAQCLAHLGRTREAVEITQKALRQNADDLNVLQAAPLVYALVGDRASAKVNIQTALEKGVKAYWFNLPAFASLQNDPEFREILRNAPGAPSRP
ncbi:MAG TPA: serine/threonine-protein kinase [Thermoanaerobaculia bacterium]|jgi:serine/threonine-protein kinase|nr:serine/threonine-protein kinase [Thermoanaerobaculia bacterium]